MARVVGGLPSEVVVMNSLTVNLHLMLVSFYRPTKERYKVLMEEGAFPSDQYAVASQVRFHGLDPADVILEIPSGDPSSLMEVIAREGKRIALLLLGNVNFRTGEAFDMEAITEAGHAQGCNVGFDLAHGAGNLLLKLHEWKVDFAVWCGYKYLNSGPGGLAGCFVHEQHARAHLPRFEGWWGHDKHRRFEMAKRFEAIPGVEGWQLSNPPILPMAALRASLELFDRATMPRLRAKSERLTGFLEYLLDEIRGRPLELVTPRDPERRGCHLSYAVRRGDGKAWVDRLAADGVVCDFRSPNVIRLAPVPLYNRFEDVYRLAKKLEGYA
jgi:kynureninase